MATINDVASYILTRLAPGRSLETVKLQKLLFLCQGWHYGVFSRPLFDDDFEAWRLGPVNRPIYKLHAGAISVPSTHNFRGNPSALKHDEKDLVDAVLTEYGGKGAFELVAITHSPGSPWDETHRQEDDENDTPQTISKELISEFYAAAASQRRRLKQSTN